jgi:DNA-binding helix-hairpin-helix protein with protein kinase domain
VKKPVVVYDVNGASHELRDVIGEGGQGRVWRTTDGRRIVKCLFAAGAPETLRRRLAFVRGLDLAGLHVARPIALLRAPAVGYVAEFLADMVAARTLQAPPRSASLTGWYLATGGLRRRLRLLAHAGETLAALHALGLAYGDLSPANVFVSASVDHHEAWLIDLDNLRHDSVSSETVATPGYGAPELISGRRGATSLSDAWAFAVLVHQTLRLVHPFVGDLVAEGEPELEEDAFAARLPWIEHSTEDHNRATGGLPREVVFNDRLLELARRTFESPGHAPTGRPSVSAWVDRLHSAADQTLRCRECAGTYFAAAEACPWCDRPRDRFVRVIVRRWEPGRGVVGSDVQPPVARLMVGDREIVDLSARITEGRAGPRARASQGAIARRERGLFVQSAPGVTWFTAPTKAPPTEGARVLPERGATLPTEGDGWRLHFGPLDEPHRVAIVREVAG